MQYASQLARTNKHQVDLCFFAVRQRQIQLRKQIRKHKTDTKTRAKTKTDTNVYKGNDNDKHKDTRPNKLADNSTAWN